MMFKKLLPVALFILSAAAAKADEGQKVTSQVKKVTVFLSGAQVTRTAMVNIEAGVSELIFGGISPGIDIPSIQVKAGGDFTILSVKHEMNFLNEQAKQKSVEELQGQQKAIKDKITLQNNLLAIYQEEETMLSKNQVVSGENTGLDIVKLKQALEFQTERLTGLKEKELAVNNEISGLNIELKKYDQQIADIKKGRTTATSDIILTVSAKAPLQTVFTLSYVVHDASWYPTYDIRAKDVNSPLNITYKANVSQQSGEDWKNIKLTLSTGNPTTSGSKPELRPYYLGFGMYYSNSVNNATNSTGRVTGSDDKLAIVGASVRIKGTSIGTVTDVNGNFSLQIPPGNQTLVFSYIGYQPLEMPFNGNFVDARMTPSVNSLNEVVVVGYGSSSNYSDDIERSPRRKELQYTTTPIAVNKIENQTNVEFNIEIPYSIPSDGKQYTAEINRYDLNTSYQYSAAPKLSSDVFLSAKITNWNKYNLLSGETSLFFEGTFIGKSLLNTDATNDTLTVSLGADKNIVITRTSLKDLTERQSLGSNKKETKDWNIEIKNRKNQPIDLLVEDQVPVTQNTAIEVEPQELSGGKLDANTGKVSWTFHLDPQGEKKIELKYQVKYPKNQTVIVQ